MGRKDYHRWALLPRDPSDSLNPADHHLTNLHCLSINKITLHMKIGCATVPTSEWLWGKGGWTAPTFPSMEWFINCKHVPGWCWRVNYRSCSPGPRGDNLILWMMITQGGAPLGKCQWCQVQLDRTSQLGWENGAGRGDCKYHTERLSYCRCHCGKEN